MNPIYYIKLFTSSYIMSNAVYLPEVSFCDQDLGFLGNLVTHAVSQM